MHRMFNSKEMDVTEVTSEEDSAQSDMLESSNQNIPQSCDDRTRDSYTEDFECTSKSVPYTTPRSSRLSHALSDPTMAYYSDDFEPLSASKRSISAVIYSEDFESVTARSIPTGSEDYDTATATLKSIPTTSYSDDFQTATSRSSQFVSYSTDFESLSGQNKSDLLYTTDTFETAEELPASDDVSYSTTSRTSVLISPRKSGDILDDTENSSTSAFSEISLSSFSEDSALEAAREQTEAEFFKRKLELLRGTRQETGQGRQFVRKTPALNKKEQKVREQFCAANIKRIQDRRPRKADAELYDSLRRRFQDISSSDSVEEYGISPYVINKLKTRNTLEEMKKVAEMKVHDPRKCKNCKKQSSDLARSDFLAQKKSVVMKKLVEEKLDWHMIHNQDSVGLIGEVVQGLPLSQSPAEAIYKRLTYPLTTRQPDRKLQASIGTQQDPGHHGPSTVLQPNQILDFPTEGKEFWEYYFSRLKQPSVDTKV